MLLSMPYLINEPRTGWIFSSVHSPPVTKGLKKDVAVLLNHAAKTIPICYYVKFYWSALRTEGKENFRRSTFSPVRSIERILSVKLVRGTRLRIEESLGANDIKKRK